MQATPTVPGTHRSTFVMLCTAVFIEAVGIGVLFPLLARVQAAHHLPTYGLGFMSGASFFAALIGQLGLAPFLDGRRARRVLIGGMVLGTIAPLWFAFGTELWSLTASRAVGGVASGIVMPAALRAGTAGIAEDKRGSRLGILASAQMAGIVLGPIVGVSLYDLGGLRLPFEVVAVTAGVLLVLIAATPGAGAVPEKAHDPKVAAADPEPRPVKIGQPAVIAVLLFAAGSQLPNGFYDALWSRLLTDRGASTLLIGLSLTLFGLPYVALAPLGGKWAARGNPLVWASVGLIVSTAFMASYGFVASPVVVVVLGMFEACAQAVAVPGGFAAAAAIFPDKSAATGQGWVNATGTAAAGAGALIAAPLYGALGSGPVFAGGAGVSALCAVAAVTVQRRSGSHPATKEKVAESSPT